MSSSGDIRALVKELDSIRKASSDRVSSTKISAVVKLALTHAKKYRNVVDELEKFSKACGKNFKIYALYVIDAVIRQTPRKLPSKEANVYSTRFAKNIIATVENMSQECPRDQLPKIEKIIVIWEKDRVFPSYLCKQLKKVHKEATINRSSSSSASRPASSSEAQAQEHSGKRKSSPTEAGSGEAVKAPVDDFDYGDEDDDADRLATLKRRRIEEEQKVVSSTDNLYQDNKNASNDNYDNYNNQSYSNDNYNAGTNYNNNNNNDYRGSSYSSNYNDDYNNGNNANYSNHNYNYDKSGGYNNNNNYNDYNNNNDYSRNNNGDYNYNNNGSNYNSGYDDNGSYNYQSGSGSSYNYNQGYGGSGSTGNYGNDPTIPVYSITIWLGEVDNGLTEDMIRGFFSPHGEVKKVVLNRNNKCAFVTMGSRKCAENAKSSCQGQDICGFRVKMGWGKGRAHTFFKERWMWKEGVSYIPASKVSNLKDMKTLVYGTYVDPHTIPEDLVTIFNQAMEETGQSVETKTSGGGDSYTSNTGNYNSSYSNNKNNYYNNNNNYDTYQNDNYSSQQNYNRSSNSSRQSSYQYKSHEDNNNYSSSSRSDGRTSDSYSKHDSVAASTS
eukprot:Nk52_evm3s278 gene=Nk52_evmTU3s278